MIPLVWQTSGKAPSPEPISPMLHHPKRSCWFSPQRHQVEVKKAFDGKIQKSSMFLSAVNRKTKIIMKTLLKMIMPHFISFILLKKMLLGCKQPKFCFVIRVLQKGEKLQENKTKIHVSKTATCL